MAIKYRRTSEVAKRGPSVVVHGPAPVRLTRRWSGHDAVVLMYYVSLFVWSVKNIVAPPAMA